MTPFSLRSLTRARNAADMLRDALGAAGLETPKLSTAQETVARLMGHRDWNALVGQVSSSPVEGVEDRDLGLLDAELLGRRDHQIEVLRDRHAATESQARSILAAVRPTGRDDNSDDLADGKNWPDLGKLGLRLTDTDRVLRAEFVRQIKEFDGAARGLLRILPEPGIYQATIMPGSHRQAADEPIFPKLGLRYHFAARNQRPKEALLWKEAMTPCRLAEANRLDRIIHGATRQVWELVLGLGAAPFLMPIERFTLKLQRSLHPYPKQARRARDYFSPIERESVIWVDHPNRELGGHHGLEWEADRWLDLVLGARRAFLDAGWSGEGEPWLVSFRIGGGAVETRAVAAPDAADAVLWVASAIVATQRMHSLTRYGNIRITRVQSLSGLADVSSAVERAAAKALWRTPLIGGVILKAAPSRKPISRFNVASEGDLRIARFQDPSTPWKPDRAVPLPDPGGPCPVALEAFEVDETWEELTSAKLDEVLKWSAETSPSRRRAAPPPNAP